VDEYPQYRASYLLSGLSQEEVFATLLDVGSFPEWAIGLRSSRALDAGGAETREVVPGTTLEFSLSAGGFSHRIVTAITAVEPPGLLEWRYVSGAVGSGNWLVEEASPSAVRLTLSTDYEVKPEWLNKIAHRPVFRGLTEQLLRRSIRHLEQKMR
jgi:ribosome-associated toxin RatA of RatAB toxin-antitoxin module